MTIEGEDSAYRRIRSTSGSIPSMQRSANRVVDVVRIRADSRTLRAITGIAVLSSKAPVAPAQATAASLPTTWAATWEMVSHSTGLTLPGMIDDPGCRSGRWISDNPVMGPDPIHRTSLAILVSETAIVRSAPESSTRPSRADCASNGSSARRSSSSPVSERSSSTTAEPKPSGALSPVPAAVPPIGSSPTRGRVAHTRSAPARIWRAYPPNSWPRVTGTASMRWVRPDLTTSRHSTDLRSNDPASTPSAGTSSVSANSVAATCVAVGKVSLEDCDMLTSSFGWTVTPSAAHIEAMTSLAFMFELVPEPVWNTSTGKWSSTSPSAIRPAADTMASTLVFSRRPRRPLTVAQADLSRPRARICARSRPLPETGKFSTARWVWARQSASTGTRTSPMVSCSIRNPLWSAIRSE